VSLNGGVEDTETKMGAMKLEVAMMMEMMKEESRC